MEALLGDDRKQGFDLRVAPLVRFTVVKPDARGTRLVWTFHHILLDGRSIPLVLEDAFAAYQALGKAGPCPRRSGRRSRSLSAGIRRGGRRITRRRRCSGGIICAG
jgi:NRPS condensation-like uncharacterized protein